MAPNNTDRSNSNYTPSLIVKSNAGDGADVVIWGDPATHALLVTGSFSISGLSGSKSNNAAAPTNDNLGALTAVASAAAPTYTEGRQVLLSVDNSGQLRVTGSLSVGGTTDNSAFTAGTSTGTPAMGFYHSTIDAVTDGRAASVAITANRAFHMNLRTAAGVELLGQQTMAASLPVVLASNQASIPVAATLAAETTKVIGTVRTLGNVGAIVDGVVTAATSPANGYMTLGIYNSTEPTLTTGQSAGIQVDSKGRQRGVIMDAAGNTRGANVDANNNLGVVLAAETTKVIGTINIAAAQTLATVTTVGTVTTVSTVTTVTTVATVTSLSQFAGNAINLGNGTAGTGTLRVAIASDNTAAPTIGGSATGAAVPATARYIAGIATTANPSAATGGNLVGAMFDKLGKQVTVGSIRDLKVNQITTITSSVSETTVVTAGAAGVFHDIYGLIVTNTSATAVNVAFKDSTAGTTQFNIAVPAGETRGFMLPEGGGIKQGTAANNWTATCSASVASVIITALAVKNI